MSRWHRERAEELLEQLGGGDPGLVRAVVALGHATIALVDAFTDLGAALEPPPVVVQELPEPGLTAVPCTGPGPWPASIPDDSGPDRVPGGRVVPLHPDPPGSDLPQLGEGAPSVLQQILSAHRRRRGEVSPR